MCKRMLSGFFVLLLLFVNLPAFAYSEMMNKYEIGINVVPTVQHIDYSASFRKDKTSQIGFGFVIDIQRLFNEDSSIGLDVQYEYHNFIDFHSYRDLKFGVESKFSIFDVNHNKKLPVYLTMELGFDYVKREDKDLGFYPLVELGAELQYRKSEKFYFTLGFEAGLTYQDGSVVFHYAPVLGGSFVIDRDKDRSE